VPACPRPTRTFLEIDELVALEDAAARQDPTIPLEVHRVARATPGRDRRQLAARVIAGTRPARIATDLGSPSRRSPFTSPGSGPPRPTTTWGAGRFITTLGRSGVRVSELGDMRIGHLRLHDPTARFHIPDAKTEAGIREVQMSPELAEVLLLHLDGLRRAGHPTTPEAWVFTNRRGGRLSRQRVAEIVTQAACAGVRHPRRAGQAADADHAAAHP
jgi:integrase